MGKDIKKVLAKIPAKQLQAFVAAEIEKHGAVVNDFMAAFPDYFPKEVTAESFVSQVEKMLGNPHTDWTRYFNDFDDLYDEVCNLLDSLRSKVGTGFKPKRVAIAISLCFTALKLTDHVSQYSEEEDDDSVRLDIDFMLIEALDAIAKSNLTENDRRLLIDQCFGYIRGDERGKYDFWIEVLKILVTLADGDKGLCVRVDSLIGDLLKEYSQNGYDPAELIRIKKELLAKWKGGEAARNYLLANLQNKEIRTQTIDEAIAEKDYALAYKLGIDGITQDKERYPGRVYHWYECLLKVAQAEGNTSLIVDYARSLYLNDSWERGNYYQLLKDNVPAERWPAFVEALAKDAPKSRYSVYPKLCVREGWTDRLYAYVCECGFDTMQCYEKHLLPQYNKEVIGMYVNEALAVMVRSTRKRSNYEKLCGCLKHVKKLGGKAEAMAAGQKLRSDYPHCRALHEELAYVGL